MNIDHQTTEASKLLKSLVIYIDDKLNFVLHISNLCMFARIDQTFSVVEKSA